MAEPVPVGAERVDSRSYGASDSPGHAPWACGSELGRACGLEGRFWRRARRGLRSVWWLAKPRGFEVPDV
jgi:hypothetical protein